MFLKEMRATVACEPWPARILVLVFISCCLGLTFAHLAMPSIASRRPQLVSFVARFKIPLAASSLTFV